MHQSRSCVKATFFSLVCNYSGLRNHTGLSLSSDACASFDSRIPRCHVVYIKTVSQGLNKFWVSICVFLEVLFYRDVQKKWAPRYSKDDSAKSVRDFLWIILVDVIQSNESEWVSITRTLCEKRRFSSLHVGDNITSHRGM